jgi:integrase
MMIDGRSVSETFDTYDEAVDWRFQQIDRRRRGLSVDPGAPRIRFDQWWTQWRAGVIRRANTLARYDSLWRTHLQPRWGPCQLGKITRADAQVWVAEMMADGLAPASIRKAVYVMATCLQAAIRSDILEKNPFRDLDLPEDDDDERRFLRPEEAHAVVECIDPWWQLIVAFGMDTGLRLAEFGGLKVSDLDLIRGTAHVRRIVTEPHGRIRLSPLRTS